LIPALGIYVGDDNRYFLQRNTQRLQDWIKNVTTSGGSVTYKGEKYNLEFTITGDYVFLQSSKTILIHKFNSKSSLVFASTASLMKILWAIIQMQITSHGQ
jgi:hypothetical protein